MKVDKRFFEGYENTKLVRYDNIDEAGLSVVDYDDLHGIARKGVLKLNMHKDGRLVQLYTENDNHVGVIAGTRLGKTTSYVIPTVLSFARQKVKKSMIISDPKGEIYRYTAETLRKEGYTVKLLNFRSYLHSECWNLLTPIYRAYKEAQCPENRVNVVEVDGKLKSEFNGRIYDSQEDLDADIENEKMVKMAEVGNMIDGIGTMFIATENQKDPYWEDSARELLKAFLWAMLEDSDKKDSPNMITEDTYSFSSILSIVKSFKDGTEPHFNDGGYFSSRPDDSLAYSLAKNVLIENAPTTRKCVMGTFRTKLSVFNESAMRLITSCNSFEMKELTEKPVVFFIDYRDELKAHYKIISLFVRDAYRYLIETANEKPDGKLDVPFYFILDEFGNFPKIEDFETTISACAGRQIFFILIIQSYSQLNSVYGKDVAEIIRDNLNVHVFFGSNNFGTLKEFAEECGKITRISPLSVLNGKDDQIEQFELETIPLIPISRLSHFEPGECIITEANCGYVMVSKLERYYLCDEFKTLPLSSEKEYICEVNPLEKRYIYTYTKVARRSSYFD